jgi:hypothetical protein
VDGTIDPGEVVRNAQESSDRTPILLYAASCGKCRFLSSMVVTFSLNRIRRVPLDIPQWQKLYAEDFPQAHGSPILFYRGRASWGMRVFVLTPVVVAVSALRALRETFAR